MGPCDFAILGLLFFWVWVIWMPLMILGVLVILVILEILGLVIAYVHSHLNIAFNWTQVFAIAICSNIANETTKQMHEIPRSQGPRSQGLMIS